MDYNEELCWFDKMSDDILLQIFIFVPRTCWKDLSHVCTRFKNVCLDKEIFRVSDLNSTYGWSNNDLKDYLKAGHRYIETLNLSHCYWFSSLVLTTYISKCKNTKSLSLLDCKLTQQGLSKILLSLVNLESLIISVSNLLDFSNAINENLEIQESLKNLKHFGLHNREEIVSYSANTMGFHVSQQVAIFQHCPNIESFSVIGTPCIGQKFAKRLVHPLITKNNNLCNLKVMSINDTENATSRLYFFSVLVRACKLPGIQFSNLSVAGLDFKKAATTHSYFVKSLQGSLPTLKRLDLSKSEIDEFETSMLVPESLNLTHLNLAHVRSEKRCIGLLTIASKCKNLVSLNLKGATSGCRVWGQDELNGLSCVLETCNNLQHLNLACIHIHEDDTTCSLLDVLTKHNISEFRSLALSVCCLVTKTTMRSQTSNGYISKGPSKRQRISRLQEAGTSSINDSKGSNSLSELSKSCPKLTSLEIIDADCHQSCIIPSASNSPCEQSHKFNDSDLRDLSNWKELNYLQLTCLPGVKSLPCLKVKGESLSTLRVLHLTNIGLGALTPGFWSLLQYFTQLKDLRIEQPLMKLDERFFTPCLQCIQLERLVLISKHCKIQSKPLESFVEKASNLYMIYLITDTTLKECDRLRALLQKRYENRRPGFQVLLEQIDHERLVVKLSSLPLKHLDEITTLTSRVCSQTLNNMFSS